MKYLGYVLIMNNRTEHHVRVRVKKASLEMEKLWSISVRVFTDDFKWRMKLLWTRYKRDIIWVFGNIIRHRYISKEKR